MITTSVSLLDRLCGPADQTAWKRFVDLYGPVLLAWARRLGLSSADAADLVQEVLSILVVKLPQFQRQREGSFRAWLGTVTRNKWLELQRRRRPEPRGDGRDFDLSAPDPADEFWEKEARDYVVGRALDLMKADFQPSTWQAAWDVVVREQPPAEVARSHGMTVGAVHAARFRVLARLRQELAGMLD